MLAPTVWLEIYLPPYHRTGSLSHLHGPAQTQGLKLQHCRLQISLHSPHMPDRGEERITGFTASGPAFSQAGPTWLGPYWQTLAAHKDVKEESPAGDRQRGEAKSEVMLERAEGGRIEARKCGQKMIQRRSGSAKMKTSRRGSRETPEHKTSYESCWSVVKAWEGRNTHG